MKKITLLLLFLFISVSNYSQVIMATEGFDIGTGISGPLPATWSLGTGDWKVFENNTPSTITSVQNWGINAFANGIFHSSPQCASVSRENNGAGSVSEDYLVTPPVHINPTGTNEVHFWTRMFTSGNQGTTYKVMWASAANDPLNPNSYIDLQQWSELTLITPVSNFDQWTEKTVQLPNFLNDQDIYIAFVRVHNQVTGGLEGDRWLLDDVGIASQCTTPTGLTIVGGTITSTTANLTWANPSGATTWEIEVVPSAGTPTGTPSYPPYSGALPFTATGLIPNTAYKFYVRAICSTGFSSPWSVASANFTTQVAPPVCGGNLVDSGGIAGNYGNLDNVTTTVNPVNPGDLVTVTFTAFNTQAGVDILRIYDGPTGASPLIAALSGTALPPSYTASSASGSLTFVFTSNNATVFSGYAASITCNPAPACRIPTAVTTSLVTTTSVKLDWIQPANADTSVASVWDIYAVTCGSPAPTSGTTPTANDVVSAGPTPTYILTGLTPASCYDIYIRAVCAGNSGWIQVPVSITTLVAPPVCGGNYVDTGGLAGNYSNTEINLTTIINPVTPGDAVTVTFTSFNTQLNTDLLRVYDGDSATGTTLLATLSGTTLPPSFISSHPSGSLTFVFNSNGTTTAPGWVANVTCAPKPTCTAPTLFAAGTATHNSVPLSWTQAANPDGSPITWEIIAQSCTLPAPTATSTGWLPVGTNPFTLTGLIPNTCYNIYLRSACGSTIVGPVNITTLVAPPECGGSYVDAGGPTGDYANSANITTIICPNNPGDVVTVTFTEFNTEATWDGIYVYNGSGIVTANLISSGNPAGNTGGPLTTPGAYWGTTIPCPFTSTAANGCLTFVFKSDTGGVRPGWFANVTCAAPPTCSKPISVAAPAATVTYNSAVLNWTQPANPDTTIATAWQVLKLPCNSPAPDASATGFVDVATAPPYTLTGLDASTCYDIYVRAVCGTGTSAWSCPKVTITTPIAPPVCGGIFVDAGGPNANYPAVATDTTTTICPATLGDTVTVSFTFFETEVNNDGLYVYDGNSIAAPPLASTNGAQNVPGGVPGSFFGTLTGTNLPGPFTSSSPDGCLTFRFRTGAFGNDGGWLANVTCAPAPNCLKPVALTATNIGSTSATLGWTEPSPNTVTQWEILVLPAPAQAPSQTTSGLLVGSNPAFITGLLPGTQYSFWVRGVCPTSGNSLWSNAGSFLTLIANDNCDGAIFAPVNSSAECQQVTPGTITGATATTGVPASCIGNANDDVWYQFIASNLYLNVALQNVVGSTQNLNFAVYSGQCGTLTQVFCSTANELAGTINALTVGQTYYIRVWSNAAAVQTVNFDLCISTPSTCPTGSTICSLTNYVNTTGVDSLGTIGCLSSSPNPTYFTLNVATSGPINFLLTQSTTPGGTPDLDVDYAAWGPFSSQAAGCTAISGGQAPGIGVPVTQTTGCSFSAASTETLNIANAQAGQFYIILITNYSDDPGFINLTQTNSTTTGAGATNCCPNAYFKYVPAAFCRVPTTPNPTPIITTGSASGTFSSTAGLVFLDSGTNTGSLTGQINIMASTAGNYLVTNTTLLTPTCPQQFSQNYTINITEPTSAVITYNNGAPAAYCKSDTTLHAVTQTGTPNGNYSAIPNIGLSINPTTGEINPSLSSPGIYTVVYGLPGVVCTVGNPSTTVEIYASPTIPYQAPIVACDTTILPALTVGNYYATSQLTGPATTPIDPLVPITTNQTLYIYAINANGCTSERSFTVTINPKPVITPPQVITADATCLIPGSIAVNGFPNTGASPAPNLFMSEVTDSTAGSLTYIEIYNGTGAPVNLTGYKLRTYSNGAPTFTAGCDNNLTGTLANNAVRIIAVGTTVNAPGVTPNQTFAGCGGVNYNDCIKLLTTANVVVDIWGRTDGVGFTPLNQPGYSYKRLGSAPHPSTTFNPADWNVTDWTATTEDYSDVGLYSFLAGGYEFALDSNTFIPSNTATGVSYTNVTPGPHTVTVRDIVTGCTSDPYSVTVNLIGATPTDSDFSYGLAPATVCELSTTNPMPIPTNAGTFTTGGVYSLVPATQTGLALNPNTGEIDLSSALTVPGTYTIIYNVGDAATCLEFNSTTVQITIAPATPAEIGFNYNNNLAICPIGVTTVTPNLNTGFVPGGSFGIAPSTGGITVDASTGVLTFAATVTPDTYIVTYNGAGDDLTTCTQGGGTSTANVIITAPTNANVGFGYPVSVCALVNTIAPINVDPNLTTGGTFTINPTTGVTINGSTGVVTFGDTASGNYTVVYTVQPNTTTCQALTASSAIPFTITPATDPVVGFHYDSPVCAGTTVNPMPILDAGFVTGGTFGPSSLVDTATGEVTGTLTPGQQYTITYTLLPNTTTCKKGATPSATISAAAPIEVDIAGECISNKFTLTANPVNGSFVPADVTYEWTNATGIVVGAGQTLIITPTMGPGQYSVEVDLAGCTGSDVDTFTNVGCQIQKGISVNDDTFNDTFDLSGFDVKQLTIFNRLGMKVYARANYVNEWGGKSDDGDELPDGTYFYVIDTNAGKTETGWIYINRAQ